MAFPLFMAAREIYGAKVETVENKIKYFDSAVLVILFLAAVGSGVMLL